MKELVKIQENENGQKVVSAKELYTVLGYADSNYSRWAKKHIEANPYAIEGIDWLSLIQKDEYNKRQKGNFGQEYVLTLDFAKKLCMISKTVVGEKVRNYFLEVEKIAKQAVASQMIDYSKFQELENKLNRLEASTITSEVNEFSIHGYCGLYKIKVAYNEALALGKLAAKKCREQSEPIGRIRDYRFGMVNIYPEHILKQAFEEFFKQPRF